MTKMFGLPKYIPLVGEVLSSWQSNFDWKTRWLVHNPLDGYAFVITPVDSEPRYEDCVWYETLEAAKLAREMAK